MRRKKKGLIRINLNKKKGFLENLKSLDISSLKEVSSENIYPLTFLIAVALLAVVLLINLYLKKKVTDLNEELAKTRTKKDRILAEIRRLENEIREIEFEKKLIDYLKKYNKGIIEEIQRISFMPDGVVVQNVSVCARLSTTKCDIERASTVTLDKPIFQVDLVVFKDDIQFSNYVLLRQTNIKIGGVPVKRLCLLKKEGSVRTTKRFGSSLK